jgi:hypothetical protein
MDVSLRFYLARAAIVSFGRLLGNGGSGIESPRRQTHVAYGSDRDLTVFPRRADKIEMLWDLALIPVRHHWRMLISLGNRGDEHGNRA